MWKHSSDDPLQLMERKPSMWCCQCLCQGFSGKCWVGWSKTERADAPFKAERGRTEVTPSCEMLLLGDVSITRGVIGPEHTRKQGNLIHPIYMISIVSYHIISFHISYIIYHISLYHIISHSIPQCRIWVLMTFYAVRSKDSDAAGSNFMAAQLLGNASLQVDLHVSFGRCFRRFGNGKFLGVSNNDR